MKIINWWVDRYSIGGLIILSILAAISSLVILCYAMFDINPVFKIGGVTFSFSFMDYKKGIAIPVSFNNSTGDTSIFIKTKNNNTTGTFTYSPDINRALSLSRKEPAQYLSPTDTILTKDTIRVAYLYLNWRYTKEKTPLITKGEIRKGIIYIKPETFWQRCLLLLPQMLFLILVFYGCWQLGFLLHDIQAGNIFHRSNYAKLRNMGIAMLLYQAFVLVFHFLFDRYNISISYKSSIPGFRSPLTLLATPDYDFGWWEVLTGCIIIIIAKAFIKGHQLQKEQDLTI